MDDGGDFVAEEHGANAAQLLPQLLGDDNQIILANFRDLQAVNVFIIEGVVILIMGNQLL